MELLWAMLKLLNIILLYGNKFCYLVIFLVHLKNTFFLLFMTSCRQSFVHLCVYVLQNKFWMLIFLDVQQVQKQVKCPFVIMPYVCTFFFSYQEIRDANCVELQKCFEWKVCRKQSTGQWTLLPTPTYLPCFRVLRSFVSHRFIVQIFAGGTHWAVLEKRCWFFLLTKGERKNQHKLWIQQIKRRKRRRNQ